MSIIELYHNAVLFNTPKYWTSPVFEWSISAGTRHTNTGPFKKPDIFVLLSNGLLALTVLYLKRVIKKFLLYKMLYASLTILYLVRFSNIY